MLPLGNAFVTGASSGIGAATALLLAAKGYQVWGTTRDLSRVQGLPPTLKESVRFVEMDVTRDESVADAVKKVLSEAGKIDVLVNNAGGAIYGPIEEVPVELAKKQFELNVFGMLRVTQAVVPDMRRRRSGTIVNISSLAGKLVIPFQSHYSASKYAVEAFTEGLRQELRPFGVRVIGVLPGDIKTEFNNATQFPEDLWSKNSPYQRWIESSWRTIDVNLKKAPPPDAVAEKVVGAILSRNPKARYAAGDFASRQFPWISRFLPDTLREWVIRLFYQINFR